MLLNYPNFFSDKVRKSLTNTREKLRGYNQERLITYMEFTCPSVYHCYKSPSGSNGNLHLFVYKLVQKKHMSQRYIF